MDAALFTLFLAAAATFAVIPGPSIVYLIGRTLAGGRRAGFAAMAGVHAGGYVHILAATAGLAALFEAVPLAFTLVKTAGAVYVAYLGVQLLRHPTDLNRTAPDASLSFWQSAMTEVLNPTTALFFFAFLPQFVSPDAALPVAAQLLILGVITNLMFSLADLPFVLGAAAARQKLTQTHLAARIQQGGGALLVALSAYLLFSRSNP
ncbi:MAG: LysE family translocator [Pseudomonadota bacterium]